MKKDGLRAAIILAYSDAAHESETLCKQSGISNRQSLGEPQQAWRGGAGFRLCLLLLLLPLSFSILYGTVVAEAHGQRLRNKTRGGGRRTADTVDKPRGGEMGRAPGSSWTSRPRQASEWIEAAFRSVASLRRRASAFTQSQLQGKGAVSHVERKGRPTSCIHSSNYPFIHSPLSTTDLGHGPALVSQRASRGEEKGK